MMHIEAIQTRMVILSAAMDITSVSSLIAFLGRALQSDPEMGAVNEHLSETRKQAALEFLDKLRKAFDSSWEEDEDEDEE